MLSSSIDRIIDMILQAQRDVLLTQDSGYTRGSPLSAISFPITIIHSVFRLSLIRCFIVWFIHFSPLRRISENDLGVRIGMPWKLSNTSKSLSPVTM